MAKKDKIKIFTDDFYGKATTKKYETNKILYNHVAEIWSIALADMIDYKTSNSKRFRYIIVINDNFSKYLWCIPFKNKYTQTFTNDFSNILTTSKRKHSKLESDRGTEIYNNKFQNFLNFKIILQYSRFTDKGPSIAERVIRTIRNLF